MGNTKSEEMKRWGDLAESIKNNIVGRNRGGTVNLSDDYVWGGGGVTTCETAVQVQVILGWGRVLALNGLGKLQLSQIVWREWIPPPPLSFSGVIKGISWPFFKNPFPPRPTFWF